MGDLKSELMVECQRLDLEYETLRRLGEDLRAKGYFYEADNIDETNKHIYSAMLHIRMILKRYDM